MGPWLVILLVLANRLTVTSVYQSYRKPLRDTEDVHDLYNGGESLEDIRRDLLSSMSGACDVSNIIARMIMKETEERSKLALRLQARLRKLTTKVSSIKPVAPPAVPVVAFSARVGAHIQNLRPLQIILFKDVLTSVGGGFNAASGQFRCSMKGLYEFHVTIISGYNERIETELVVNTKSKIQLYAGGSKHGAASNTAILILEEGDNVWVRVFRNRGKFVHSWSSFAGHLLSLID